jgi:uncharacterized membrane-anchored protein YhcB (DUF1043 family)
MEWVQVITIIASIIGGNVVIMGIITSVQNKRFDDINKRIDDLRQDVDRRFSEMDRRLDRIEQDIREIRQLLYKAFELPHREDK